MITVPLIDWKDMASMPEDRKDGRAILLWSEFDEPRVGRWDDRDYFGSPFGWVDCVEDGATISPVYWADINPPE